MNTFIHRLFKSSTSSSINSRGVPALKGTVQNLLNEVQNAKLLYLGEFHGESRIVALQTELVREWSRRLASSSSGAGECPRLHLIMEHFSVDMQDLLERYQCVHVRDGRSEPFSINDDEAFDQLMQSYKNDYGTEGHDLAPYSELLQFCRQTTVESTSTDANEKYCQVLLHGGFIPRNHAARLNKECPDEESKRKFLEEMSNERGYLPKSDDAMFNALFEPSCDTKLKGPKEHKRLIQSLMTGVDLYSPTDDNEDTEEAEETKFDRLYQAQLLKDQAMAYRITNLMMDQPSCDRYLIIAGFGHLKHYLGVPECVKRYLRQVATLHNDQDKRSKALDLLMDISCLPTNVKPRNNNGKGAALIGCQMMYEAYLEDNYSPLVEEIANATEADEDADTDEIKRKMIKHLYLHDAATLDEYILKSDEVNGPFLHFNRGIGRFDHPCADYLYIYDDDDDNIITDSDITQAAAADPTKCPHQSDTAINNDAKQETLEAYQQVGETAGFKGNAKRARAIMTILGYTQKDLDYLGDGDIYNFQGVANPHSVAKIQPGESVIDIGSGLGIDSFLAVRDCGADRDGASSNSFVVGVDLAPSEVQHAETRGRARGYESERLRFIQGDVEKLEQSLMRNGLPSEGSFDVCISNGAFCLVPDKKKAFQNVFNALRSGGRCAISTTTIISNHVDPSFEWPVCMRMFATLESIQPMLEEIGFKNVEIIDAESPMEGMELPEDEDTDNNKRFKIHGKYVDQFAFLEKMDMDELCKVVTIYGEKP